MNNNSIGVFDSGLGGLTVLKEITSIIDDEPILNEELVYFLVKI